MVRLPQDQRATESDINEVRIRTPQGAFVPLEQLVTFTKINLNQYLTRTRPKKVNVRAGLNPGGSHHVKLLRR